MFIAPDPTSGTTTTYTSVLIGTSTIQRVWRSWQISLWEPIPVDEMVNPSNGQSLYLIGDIVTKSVPGFRTYSGVCRDASSAPCKTSGWINSYTLESANPIYQKQINFTPV
jgi:hypothetical protein